LTSFILLFSYCLPVITVGRKKMFIGGGQTVRNGVQSGPVTPVYHPRSIKISSHPIQVTNTTVCIDEPPVPSAPALDQNAKLLVSELNQDA
jgi:hypothetical protein